MLTTSATTTIKTVYGARWDFNPAILGIDKAARAKKMFGPKRHFNIGPGGIIRVPVAPLKVLLAIIDTHIALDLMCGREDSVGPWRAYVRVAVGIGQEGSFFDLAEDIVSGFFPLFNLVPEPIAWGDMTVPRPLWGSVFSHSSWAGISVAYSEAPTAGTPTIGAFTQGWCIFRVF